MEPKRKLWSIWKEDRMWKVQFPYGILTFMTKREADKNIEAFSRRMSFVINGDSGEIVETLDSRNVDALEQVVEKYRAMKKWNDISIDINGDIVLWKE